ncbi:MAG: gamma-glutamyltransferase [Rhodobacteraceae bacterium]|jgi:gamma-glutamyltranspeptidase/glutathione hydrolase|nr:gamma-glutamyltransferase [Paracoccaceae bacterium]
MSSEPSTGADAAGGMRNADAPTPSVYPPPESLRPTLVGRDWMVAAGHPVVAQIMADVLERGGTAIDAGVAGGIASTVVQPDMCNLGGIAPVILRQAGSGYIHAISGVGTWGREVTLQAFLSRHGGDMPLGSAVAVVPAAVDALLTALRFGTRGFAELAAPAIRLAEEGFPIDARTATALEIMGRSFAQWESSRAVYWPRGRAPMPGEWLRQHDLARTLGTLAAAEAGAGRAARLEAVRRAFYEGEIARRLVAFNRFTGGWLTEADLAGFRSVLAPAEELGFGDWRVASTDYASQGPVMLQALGMLAPGVLRDAGPGSAEALHRIIEALKLAYADRERHYRDPAFAPEPLGRLLEPGYLAGLAATIGAQAAAPLPPRAASPSRPRFDTTCLCAVDSAGNAIAVVPSDTLDGGPIIPGLGIMASCRGVQSRLDPADPNAIAPGKRPRVTPAPALALNSATGEVLAIACPGGDMIVQAMLQVFLNIAVHGMLPQVAVEAPRVATFSFPNSFFPNPEFPLRVDAEARIDPAALAELSARGHLLHPWPEWEFDAGGVLVAGRLALGGADGPVLVAAADPRRSGHAAGR